MLFYLVRGTVRSRPHERAFRSLPSKLKTGWRVWGILMLLELGPQLSKYPPDDKVFSSAENAETVQPIGENK